MKTKAIIRIIAVTFTAVSIIGATTACTIKKNDTESSKEKHTQIEESTKKAGDSDNSELPLLTESTEVLSETRPITEDSIILRLDGMTTDEIVEDLWRTTRVESGMYSKDYYENIITDGCTLFKSKDDEFSWFFYGSSSDTTCYISRISIFSGMKCDPTFDGTGHIALEVHIEDKDYAFEVAEAIVTKIQSEGFEINADIKHENSWYVGFQCDRKTCTLQVNQVGDYVISFDFPLNG
ncbi:MAG: hypothetical protein J5636_07240 [Clostridiales bacterium]|nr:hypothetical protein [Clostridiales bacterium]